MAQQNTVPLKRNTMLAHQKAVLVRESAAVCKPELFAVLLEKIYKITLRVIRRFRGGGEGGGDDGIQLS